MILTTYILFVNILQTKYIILLSPSFYQIDTYYGYKYNKSRTSYKDDYEYYLSLHPDINQRFIDLGHDNIIYSNPLFDDQCRNAILHKENIDINSLLHATIKHCPQCFKQHFKVQDIIWSREMIDFMQKRHKKWFYKKDALRLPYNTLNKSTSSNETIPVPIYYMIAKCASSSVYTHLIHSFGAQHNNVIHKNYDINTIGDSHKIRTECGYTFVRNPIHRFISGYYTINKKIYKLYGVFSVFGIFDNEKWNENWRFLKELKEPNRFITFVGEMISNSYSFSLTEPMSHINTHISKAFTVFYESDLHFIGKVEYFDKHWDVLMDYCSWFNQHLVNNSKYHEMKEWGTILLEGEYSDVLGFTEYKNRNKMLYPAYYIIANNKSLYDSLVNYFFQDFVCFGYKPDFVEFKRFVEQE